MANLLLARNWSFETVDESEVPADWISYGLDSLNAYESPPAPYDGDRTCRPIIPVLTPAGLGQEDISVLQDTNVTLTFQHKLDGEPDEEILPPYPFLIVTITRTDTNAVLYESDPIYGDGAFNDWVEFTSGPVAVGAAVIGTSIPIAFKIELDPAGENVNGGSTDYFHLDAVVLEGTAGDGGGGEEEDPTTPPTGADGSGGFAVTSLELAVIRPLGTVNLDTNPSFELTLTPWAATGGGASISRVTEYAFFDSYAMEIASSGSYGAAVRLYSLTVDSVYSWSVFVQGTKDDTGRIRMVDATTEEELDSFAFPVTGKPQRVWLPEVTIQSAGTPWAAGSRNIRVYIEVWGTAPTLYADGIQLELGPCTSYCDGEQEYCTWTGTPHASTSRRLWQTLYDEGVIHLGEIVPLLNYGSITGYQISGFGMPPVEILKTPRGTGPGSFHQGIRYNERQMMISLHLDGEDPQADDIRTYEYEFALMELRQWLLDLIGPERVYDNAQFVLLAMSDPDPRKAKILQITCALSQGFGMEGVIVSYEKVVAVIEAAYPFWRSINTHVVAANLYTPLFDAQAIMHREGSGDTAVWDNMDTGLGPLGDNQVVNHIEYDADGNPIAAGAFQGAGSSPIDVRCIALYDKVTGWNSLGLDSSNLGADTVFNKVVRDPETNDLYAVGKNVVYEGDDLHCIIKYDYDTATWGPLGQGLVADTAGDTEEIYDARIIGRIIYFVGTFTQIAALTGDPYDEATLSRYVAGWDMDNEEWLALNPGDVPSSIPNASFEDYDVAGDITNAKEGWYFRQEATVGGQTMTRLNTPLTAPDGTYYVRYTHANGTGGLMCHIALKPETDYLLTFRINAAIGVQVTPLLQAWNRLENHSSADYSGAGNSDTQAILNASFEDDDLGVGTPAHWTATNATTEIVAVALSYTGTGDGLYTVEVGSQAVKVTPTASLGGISQDFELPLRSFEFRLSMAVDTFATGTRTYQLAIYAINTETEAEILRASQTVTFAPGESGGAVKRVWLPITASTYTSHRIYIRKFDESADTAFTVDDIRTLALGRDSIFYVGYNTHGTITCDGTWKAVSFAFRTGPTIPYERVIPAAVGFSVGGVLVEVNVDDWRITERGGGPLTPHALTGARGLLGYAAGLTEDDEENPVIAGYFDDAGLYPANGIAVWDVARQRWKKNVGFAINTYDEVVHIEARTIYRDSSRYLASGIGWNGDHSKSHVVLVAMSAWPNWYELLSRPDEPIEHFRKIGATYHTFGPFTKAGVGGALYGRLQRDGYSAWDGADAWELFDLDLPGNAKDVQDDGSDLFVGFDGAGTVYVPADTSITNERSNLAYPVITITRTGGSLLRLLGITHKTLNLTIGLNYDMGPDEALTIDTRPDTKGITSSLYGPRNGALVATPANLSAFARFHLVKGVNVFSVEVMGDGDNADIRIRYTNEYISIDGIVKE
jgi:hypothetical protein